MARLKAWQWGVLALPIAAILGFLATAAGSQIHQWRINWVWAVVVLVFVGWRWLLVKWLRPAALEQVETTLAELQVESEQVEARLQTQGDNLTAQTQAVLQQVLEAARADLPPWEDWATFWGRCQALVAAIAQVYYPEAKRPLLNIHIPQAYGLLRDTIDDVDGWMQKLSPVLNQVTLGQAYEAYGLYQKLEPATRTAFQIWNWSQWLLNPAAALARTATRRYSTTANQQLIVNLGQLLREQALRALGMRAIALYSGTTSKTLPKTLQPPTPKRLNDSSQSLREILAQAENPDTLAQKPLNLLLVGRTGAGKSSLINTLFASDKAAVDILPSTDRLQDYILKTESGELLILWDAPGYEQIDRPELRQQVLDQVEQADALLLVTPATDPALQMDRNFLVVAKAQAANLLVITVVTQVDRLRPLREWQPPYDWQLGERPKERSIREAVQYRQEILGDACAAILPLVTADGDSRVAWGTTALSETLLNLIPPAKQVRLARFLQDLDARTTAAAKIINQYALRMSTTQGLAALLKSPVLQFVSTLITGSPGLAVLLAEKIPVERSPVVLGKLQMAYELFSLLSLPQRQSGGPSGPPRQFNLQALWPMLLQNPASPAQDAWALGHALVEYWTKSLNPEELQHRYRHYLTQVAASPMSAGTDSPIARH